jgi:hypothetical protein
MTSESDLAKALQENLKLRRELAIQVAEAKGEKLAAIKFRLARTFGSFHYALFGGIMPASTSAGRELDLNNKAITLEAARSQYNHQRSQSERQINPGECRQHALECARMAQMARDLETKQTWSDLAKTWLIFASDLEANECLLD